MVEEIEGKGATLQSEPGSSHSVFDVAASDVSCDLFDNSVSKGNPGEAGTGGQIVASEGEVLWEGKKYLGKSVTAPESKYLGLIHGLEAALCLELQNLTVNCDSELVVKQVLGDWKTRSPELVGLIDKVTSLKNQFECLVFLNSDGGVQPRVSRLALEAIEESKGSEEPMKAEVEEKCEICLNVVNLKDFFVNESCKHSFCHDCMQGHVKFSLQARKFPVLCPGIKCPEPIAQEACKQMISDSLLELYIKLEVESSIPDKEKYYCPYSNCSALVILDHPTEGLDGSLDVVKIDAAECPECHRLFCAQCRVPWHDELTCEEYNKLPADMRDKQDIKLHKLAEDRKWKRCPQCKVMIELESGCHHMTCRCGHQFCYVCSLPWKENKPTCACDLWEERFILQAELLHRPFRLYKTQMCRHWIRGNCRRADRCPYAHGQVELARYQDGIP